MSQQCKYKSWSYKTLRIKHVINLHNFGFGSEFLDMTQATKDKIGKLDFSKIKNFYASKDYWNCTNDFHVGGTNSFFIFFNYQ